MRSRRPSVLVFDFFGVLCSEIAPCWLRQRFCPEDAVRIKREVVGLADTGAITDQQLFQSLADLSGIPAKRVREEWKSYVVIDTEVRNLIETLQSEFRISLLTNAPSGFFREVLSDHALEHHFEAVVVSSEELVAKPEPRAFRILLDRLGMQACDAVMIDDNLANVAGAIDLGMAGLVFTSAQRLKIDIAELRSTCV